MSQYQTKDSRLTTADDGRRAGPPRLIVVHTSQSANSTAVRLCEWMQNRANGASYHVVIDTAGNTCRSNDDAYIPWSAGWTGNRAGLHVCLTGMAEQTREEWLSNKKQLDRLREYLAFNSKLYGIPLRKLEAPNLDAPHKGMCGHVDVSAQWNESDHWDPGPHFPWDVVLGGEPPAETPATHVIQKGETLYSIAARHGLSVAQLAALNCIADPELIHPGQVLKLKFPD